MIIPLPLRLVFILAAALSLNGLLATAQGAVPAVGNPAPEIAGKDVNGKELKLSEHKGKAVLVDFWGDW